MNDTFVCENKECKHFVNYKMKYINVIDDSNDTPVCSYCGQDMEYSYSEPMDYSKPLMLMNKNERRLK